MSLDPTRNTLATSVPGLIIPENPKQSQLQCVSILITGIQANLIQNAINESTVNIAAYSFPVGGDNWRHGKKPALVKVVINEVLKRHLIDIGAI
jgi:GTP cyclohydrolase III